MVLSQHGFKRLVLLNSAGYSRAELPLDEAVSLIAPNNTGKTSLINALQFLLIFDKRNMDFGAYTFEISRKFYFPDNCSYILLEVLLPTGMVVIGCVGKGFTHDYDYFAYQGSLNVEDYRLENGQLIINTKLIGHLIERSKTTAKIYNSTDLKSLLYGNKQSLKNNSIDLTVFPLEMPSLASTYQKVLTRTLRLDKLSSKEVKQYLLEIFKRDVTDSAVDFKSEWDKAFADVNRDKEHFDAVTKMKADIERLEKMQLKRKRLRGLLIIQRPLIENALIEWEDYYQKQTAYFSHQQQQLSSRSYELEQRLKTIVREQLQAESDEKELNNLEHQYNQLQLQFELVKDLQQLKNYRESLQNKRDNIMRFLKEAEQLSIKEINRQLENRQRELKQTQQQLANLHDNFYLRLQQYLPVPTFQVISRLFSRNTLNLLVGEKGQVQFHNEAYFQAFAEKLATVIEADTLTVFGMKLNTATLSCELTLKTAQELENEITEIQREISRLTVLLETAKDLESKKQKQQQLEQQINKVIADIEQYQVFLQLTHSKPQRQQQLAELMLKITALKQEEQEFDSKREQLNQEIEAMHLQQRTLNEQHQRIVNARNNRPDKIHSLDFLETLPHTPNISSFEINMAELGTQLENYNRDYASLLKLNYDLIDGLHYLHSANVTKFQNQDSSEQELESLFNFTTQLAQEKIAIEHKARNAVIQISLILRELNSGLESLKRCMNDFNKLINKRKLSDLKVFKIEAREEGVLVDAIRTLISTSEKLESGDSFDLFNQGTVLNDSVVNKAKDDLIREGSDRGSLKIEHLFRLVFVLAKENQSTKEYDDIDSAASNGTVLMAKLITGLALLNLMQDNRKKIKTVCYLDEAASLDQPNQRSLIETANDFGFSLIFASPEAQITAKYCVPIRTLAGKNYINTKDWQVFERLNDDK